MNLKMHKGFYAAKSLSLAYLEFVLTLHKFVYFGLASSQNPIAL